MLLISCAAIEVKEAELKEIRSNKQYEDLLTIEAETPQTPQSIDQKDKKDTDQGDDKKGDEKKTSPKETEAEKKKKAAAAKKAAEALKKKKAEAAKKAAEALKKKKAAEAKRAAEAKKAAEAAKKKKAEEAKKKQVKKDQVEPKDKKPSEGDEKISESKEEDKKKKVTFDIEWPPGPLLEFPLKKRWPNYEDTENFSHRRPINDPYRINEKVKLEISYFGVTAGYMTMETLPFKKVNGRKAYHFRMTIKSSSTFSLFYKVEDYAETFIDYERMVPFNYVIRMDETNKVGENKALFDWKNYKAYTWERKIDKKKGKQEKNYEWDLIPWAQNVFSAPFYLRSFTLKPGKNLKVLVGHRGENIEMTAQVLRKEKLKTKMGTINTVVIKPKFIIDGDFKPVGDIVFWHTDDDQKLVVRMEAKIKIGTIVGSLDSWSRGQK